MNMGIDMTEIVVATEENRIDFFSHDIRSLISFIFK